MTRTVHFGTPSPQQVEVFTKLLKGCIDLASLKFPKGYTMQNLEIVLRAPLFSLGLQYGHGSTHGIGHFLPVHECEFSPPQLDTNSFLTVTLTNTNFLSSAFDYTYQVNFFGSQGMSLYR